MAGEGLKLSVYLGERDRCGAGLLCDELMGTFDRAGLRAAVLLRGIEGFGVKHQMQTERLLTLSEDLPALALAIDEPARISAVLEEVRTVTRGGLITLERLALWPGEDARPGASASGGESLKLTIHTGRGRRTAGAPAHEAAVALLRARGALGACVLLGLDGLVHGSRLRARFLAGNAGVPVMIEALGGAEELLPALPEVAAQLQDPLITLERVRVCKRDGIVLRGPYQQGGKDPGGRSRWLKLVVQTGEPARAEPHPVHAALVRRLRSEGAAGATTMRALWGFGGEHRPHGERFLSLTRRAPLLTVVIDTPERVARWFEIADEMTPVTGLITCEVVPALRAAAPGALRGGLVLAAPR